MRKTKLAALIDPDPKKEPGENAIKLFLKYSDYLFIGGTLTPDLVKNIGNYTKKCVERCKQYRNNTSPEIYIFPGSPEQAVSGADGILYLYIPNAKYGFYGWGIQVMCIDNVLKNYNPNQIFETVYVPLGGKAAKFVNAEIWDEDMILKSAKVANRLNFKYYYLEGGSGAEMVDIKTIEKVSKILLKPKFIYGGGVVKKEQIEELFGIVDIINIGTALEKNPEFIKVARETITNRKLNLFDNSAKLLV